MPLMLVVGGPSGSGKSTAFTLSDFGIDHFNVDDRAAELNQGNYRNIPPEIRAQANKECEDFIASHIRETKSFAVETTLRSDITFEQAASARTKGFDLRRDRRRRAKRGTSGDESGRWGPLSTSGKIEAHLRDEPQKLLASAPRIRQSGGLRQHAAVRTSQARLDSRTRQDHAHRRKPSPVAREEPGGDRVRARKLT